MKPRQVGAEQGLSLFSFKQSDTPPTGGRSFNVKRGRSQLRLVYPECRNTFVIKQEEPYEGRLSRTAP
jgi:hypothetical protein